METFDFSTVYMAVLTSNLLLAIIAVIICNEKIMINAGYKLISIFLILTAVRFMLPFEVPFATTIPLPQGISKIIIEVFASRFSISGFDVSIYHLILFIWLIGIVIQIYRFIRTNGMIKRYIFTFGRNVSKAPRHVSIMNEICGNKKSSSPFRLFEIADIQTPFLYGFATPYILLPDNTKYTDRELTYILKHEVMHYKHNDLWLKFGVHLLTIIYWWNPFSYLLSSQINLVLEMRIDDTVTGISEDETLEYMNCLFVVAEYQDSILTKRLGNVIAFSTSEETKMTRRFKMLMQKKAKKNKLFNILMLCIVTCIYICSYLFILEATYFSSDITGTSFRTMGNGFIAIDNKNGTYDIYLSDIHIEVVDSLDYYGDDIPVLTKEEFDNVQPEKLE